MKFKNAIVDELRLKAEKSVSYKTFKKKRKKLEKIVLTRYKNVEPKILAFYAEARQNAKKYGVPVDMLEGRFQNNLEKVAKIIPFFDAVVPKKKKSVKKVRNKTSTKKVTTKKRTSKATSKKVKV